MVDSDYRLYGIIVVQELYKSCTNCLLGRICNPTALSISIFNTLIHLTTVVRLHLTCQAFHNSYEQNYTDSPQVFLQSPV